MNNNAALTQGKSDMERFLFVGERIINLSQVQSIEIDCDWSTNTPTVAVVFDFEQRFQIYKGDDADEVLAEIARRIGATMLDLQSVNA